MKTKKITDAEIEAMKISSLPSRPTSASLYGGEGLSSAEMKAAFDKLPLYVIARLNSLIDDITREGDGSIAESIPTGLDNGHTLAMLFSDIENGNLASYIKIDGRSLDSIIAQISERVGI